MADKAVTISDVARRAGVSESTVSRVLSGSDTQISISQETRERVIQAAKELGYSPHPVARALRGKVTNILGLIVRSIDDPFYSHLIEAISNACKERGYDLMLGGAEGDPERALALSQILDPRRCDGLLVMGDLGSFQDDEAVFTKLETAHARLAILCRGNRLFEKSLSISVDNRRGALLAMDYLAKLGHRQIAFIHGSRTGDLKERMETYLEFMREQLGLECPEYLQADMNTLEGGYRAMQRLLSLSNPPTAVFAVDDQMAIGAIRAASDRAYQVPRDVSVIGFDDIEVAAYVTPSLTTIHQPIEEIGRKAVELVLQKVADNSIFDTARQILMEPELVIRQSCAPPSR